jgi:hypothetical protein
LSGGVYVIQHDGDLVEMNEQAYESEPVLQELLAKYPNLLAGDQSTPTRRWLLISREAAVPSDQTIPGRLSLDHLFIDSEAIPTLVEVKRSTDTRIRREVVGQMLDYAANAVAYWPVETLRSLFQSTCESQHIDPDAKLSEFLNGSDPEAFWSSVKTNLQAGKIRMLFVADIIPPELRRIVEFLNEQMEPAEVLAVEIRQFGGKSLKTLVSRTIGQTAEAEQKKSTGTRQKRQWDEATFFEALAQAVPESDVEIARRILEWIKRRVASVYWGSGTTSGSFNLRIPHNGIVHAPMGVFTNGYIEIQFEYLKPKPPFDKEEERLGFLHRLNTIPTIRIPKSEVSRRPAIPLSALAESKNLDAFLNVLDWVVKRIEQE